MKKHSKEAVVKIIVEAAKGYEERLKDRDFLIFYRGTKAEKSVQVGFRDFNYMHMTGVKSRLSAQVFYDACLKGRLSEKDFEMDRTGKVQQKLMALPYLPDLLYNHCMIGSFINSGIYIRADYFVGNTKAALSVGFRTGKTIDYPVTLYREDVRKLTDPTCKVLAILSKKYNETFYHQYTYLAKGMMINQIRKSDAIKEYVRDEEVISLNSK